MGKTPYETLKTENEQLKVRVAELETKVADMEAITFAARAHVRLLRKFEWTDEDGGSIGRCRVCGRINGRVVRTVHNGNIAHWALSMKNLSDMRFCATEEDAKAWVSMHILGEAPDA